VASRLLLVVQLSSEQARQAVRQDCSFAKKQEPAAVLPVVVRSGHPPRDWSRLRAAVNSFGAVKATA
jgi:hypothetical protein